MSITILKKNYVECHVPISTGLSAGKLKSVQVHDAKTGDMLRKVEYDNGHPNMMFQRVIHRICTKPVGAGSVSTYVYPTIEDEFDYCRLGTGTAVNSPATVDLDTPWTGANSVGWTRSRHLATDTNFNFKRFLVTTPVAEQTTANVNEDYSSDLDGEYHMVIRVSHSHPENNTPNSVTITEVAYTNNNVNSTNNTPALGYESIGGGTYPNARINSRVVLPTPVELEPGQYLVTTYEYALKLPSMRREVVPFEFTGLGLSDERAVRRFIGGFPTATTTIAGSRRSEDIFFVQRALTISAAVPAGYVSGGAGGAVYGYADASRLGVGSEITFPAIGTSSGTGTMIALNATQPNYQWGGSRTLNWWRARGGTELINMRRFDAWGYRFILPEVFNVPSGQDFSFNTTLTWNLFQDM